MALFFVRMCEALIFYNHLQQCNILVLCQIVTLLRRRLLQQGKNLTHISTTGGLLVIQLLKDKDQTINQILYFTA